MARKDYQRYDPGTTVHFQPTRQVTSGRTKKTAWFKHLPGYIVMAPTVLVLTIILSWLHTNVVLQMLIAIGGAFLVKFYVDRKLNV
jgi:putative flippase GtrA